MMPLTAFVALRASRTCRGFSPCSDVSCGAHFRKLFFALSLTLSPVPDDEVYYYYYYYYGIFGFICCRYLRDADADAEIVEALAFGRRRDVHLEQFAIELRELAHDEAKSTDVHCLQQELVDCTE
jgi:hypothetical protein